MLASVQASWKAVMASSMAFFWAELPSAFSSPLKQSPLAVAPADVPPPAGVELPGFSEAQAESARAPDRAMAPRALIRETDTSVIPLDGGWSWCRATSADVVDSSSTANLGAPGDRFSPSG